MSVFVYMNKSKQVDDPDHLKVFANRDAANALQASLFASHATLSRLLSRRRGI
jgi:hypothetical protein